KEEEEKAKREIAVEIVREQKNRNLQIEELINAKKTVEESLSLERTKYYELEQKTSSEFAKLEASYHGLRQARVKENADHKVEKAVLEEEISKLASQIRSRIRRSYEFQADSKSVKEVILMSEYLQKIGDDVNNSRPLLFDLKETQLLVSLDHDFNPV